MLSDECLVGTRDKRVRSRDCPYRIEMGGNPARGPLDLVALLVSHNDLDHWNIQISGRYIVISPQTVRPGMVYNVVVMLTSDDTLQATVYTSIARDNEVMAEASMLISTNSLATLPIKVAMSIMPGTYSVTVEGRRNGLVLFHNSSRLTFDPRFLSVVVQTSRPLYRAGQEVRFRVVAIHTDLRPFNDGLEIYVLDPDGLIMRRWISAYTNNGVSSLSFKLPKMAKDGYWKIRIKAWNQVDEQIIRVETYFDPLFEVHVKLPPYITEGEESIRGTVSGMFTTQRLVEGNATLTLLARRWNDTEAFLPLWTDHVFFKGKEYKVEIPMDVVVSRIGSLRGVEVKLQASVTELLSRETVEGYSHSRLIPGTLQLTFLSASPAVFKPGLPFYAHVALVYEDREKVSSELLMNSRLRIQVELQLESGRTVRLPDIVAGKNYENSWSIEENIISSETKERFVDELTHDEYLEQGVLRFRFDTTDTTEKIHMKASFVGEDGNTVEAKLEAVQYYSPKRKFISVFPSSNNVAVDEYAIFHVKSNFRLDSFQYLVISKSQIISGGEHKVMNSSVTTSSLSLSLSTEMAPGFTFLVVHIATDGEVLTDSCFLPVDGFSKYNTELEINTGKDHKAERLEVRASGGEGAFIGVTAVRAAIYTLQAGHEISLGRLTQRLMLLENSTRKFNKMHWKTRDGTSADKIHYFTSMNNAYDTNHTFKLADLVVFSSENVLHNPSPVVCDLVTELPCDLVSCYLANKTCDGVLDCPSGYDEFMCPVSEEKEFEYKISRMSRNEFLFDMVEGDWAWREIKVNDHKGIEFEPVRAPQTADDWYLTAFSINTDLGFSMISEPLVFSSKRNFMMSLRGPAACYSGEQIALQVDLMNHLDMEALVLLTLKGSPDYRFVNVEEGGKVSSYSARLTSGDHQVLVYLGPESQKHIDFPLTPTIEQGTVEITLVGAAQTGLSVKTHSLLVQDKEALVGNADVSEELIAEWLASTDYIDLPQPIATPPHPWRRQGGGGATINKHTSVFLDLKSRALVMSYLDIIVEETPIIPYNMNRRYVFGSTSATVEIFGDIIGPAFSTVPATLESILQTSSKGTLARVFEFGVNIWTLHYLRLTNKLQRPFLKEVLLECNAIYAQILKRFNARGSFENWDSSGFSVWLTAWTLRVLKAATYPDWEFLLHVDPRVIERGVAWLLQYQTPNGSFYDPSPPLDSKMNSQRRDVTLTAHILTTLCECMVLLSGEVKTRAVVASQRAATYLQQSLSSLSDPLHLALTVHALSVSLGHGDIQHGYHSLLRMQRQNSAGFIYWSPIEIPANPVKKENQRPFLQPRLYHEQDSVAVESTALVLLVILHREGVTQTTENIVHWLNSIRMTSGGFVSTVDTLVALQALTEYAFRARLHEITNMDVTVEFPMSGNKKHKVHIDNSSILFQTELTVPQVWGNVLVVGHGTGQAVVQMSVHYGVDHEALVEVPTVPSFDLNITEYYSTYRNKSALTIQSCLRWLREQPESSSAATLEVDSPSGYHLLESQAERVARHGSHPTLRDALVTHRKTVWFFDKIEKDWTCFNYTLRRWFPVANMSRHRQALLYEATARERFVQVLVNSTPLHVLNICEVCGSYQCPYCPHYNTAALSLIWLHLLTLSQIVLNVYI